MFTVQVPNTVFATQTSLTEGPDHDDILGTAGNDLVIGAVSTLPNQLTTLGPADIIRGGSGGEDMLSITFTGESPQAVGWLSQDMDIFQVRAFNSGDSFVNAIDMIGTSTIWFDNNTGDTDFENVQNVVNLVATGGDFNADISYAAGVAGGAVQDQEILVQGTDADFDIYGGVANLWLQANGAASSLDIGSDATTVMVKGTAPSLYIDQHGASVATFDATQFAGDLEADLYVGNGSGTATVDTFSGADDLYLYADSSSTVAINTRAGADYVDVRNAFRVELLLGDGDDSAYIGTWGSIGSGGVDVNSGKGEDSLSIYTSGGAFVRTGDGTDTLELGYVGGSADVKTGWGHDQVTNSGGVSGYLTIDLGLGNDTLSTYAGGGASVIAGEGDDNVNITGTQGSLDIRVGAGNNTMAANMSGAWWQVGNFFSGDGNDSLTVTSSGYVNATLRGGNDTVNVQGGVSQAMNLQLGAGDDVVNIGSNYLSGSDVITGDVGTDTMTATNLDFLSSGSAFGGTTGVEKVSVGQGSASFSGVATGANTALINDYTFTGNMDSKLSMTELLNNVTIRTSDNGGAATDFVLGLAVAGGTANFSSTLSANSEFGVFETVNVGTLNVTTVDNQIVGAPTLVLGGSGVFMGDASLTTLNLSGNTNVTMESIVAPSLATLNAGAVTGNVRLGLDDVADNITVTTGSGNDNIERTDGSTNFTISTGLGNDTVGAGGGNDNINLGDGTDLVQYASADLDDFDTVNGGAGTDTIQITSGGLTENDDDFFFKISGVETWLLNDDTDTLTLGNIAQSSGLQRISLGNGNNLVTLAASYSSALELTLGTASDDTVNAGLSGATLTVKAQSAALNGSDVLTGGTGLSDELQITAITGSTNLDGMTAFEKVTVVPDYAGSLTITAVDSNVAAGATLTVTGSNNSIFSPTGALVFDGSAETDGKFVITSGYGNDAITTGAGADSITSGEGNDIVSSGTGNDTVNSGGGDDFVVGDLGNDLINGGAGNDTLYGDLGSPFPASGGNDTINAGSGADVVFGGLGADIIDVGAGDGNVDTLYYTSVAESAGAIVDQVSGFLGGVGGDVINLTFFTPSQAFVGNGSSFGQSQALIVNGDGIIQVVFQVDDQVLWADVNDDGALNADDLQIHLIGVTALDAGNLALS